MKRIIILLLVAITSLNIVSCDKDNLNKGNDDERQRELEMDYIDLGLSVKWATCNIGANSPEEYGNYYAWGETEPKSEYSYDTYKWYDCNSTDTKITKYNSNSQSGTIDNKAMLDTEDDVAHAKWGGKWRMPTKEEFEELRDSCTWTRTTLEGVTGYLVTSNIEGFSDRSIFLPAAGQYSDTELEAEDTFGYYWSRSLESGFGCFLAWGLFNNGNVGATDRTVGCTVRPVYPK